MSADIHPRRMLAAAEKATTAAMWRIQEALEQLAARRLEIIQKRNPGSDVSFACAMGTWSFYRDPKDGRTSHPGERLYDDPIVDREFSRIQSDYGWGCVPVVALSFGADGTIQRRTTW